MINPTMINLAESFDKPKYIVSIRQAYNGFAVEIELEQIRKVPMSQEEAKRKITSFMQAINEQIEGGSDHVLNNLLNSAKEEEENKIPIVGLHVFKTYTEMTAFLSFVYVDEPVKP